MQGMKNENLETVTVRMKRSQRKKLERMADAQNRTVSGQLREMIDRAPENGRP